MASRSKDKSRREKSDSAPLKSLPSNRDRARRIRRGIDFGLTDLSQSTFEKHAAVLSESPMSQPQYARERADYVLRLQSDYGNKYVQRLVDHVNAQRNAPKPMLQPTSNESRDDLVQRMIVATPDEWDLKEGKEKRVFADWQSLNDHLEEELMGWPERYDVNRAEAGFQVINIDEREIEAEQFAEFFLKGDEEEIEEEVPTVEVIMGLHTTVTGWEPIFTGSMSSCVAMAVLSDYDQENDIYKKRCLWHCIGGNVLDTDDKKYSGFEALEDAAVSPYRFVLIHGLSNTSTYAVDRIREEVSDLISGADSYVDRVSGTVTIYPDGRVET